MTDLEARLMVAAVEHDRDEAYAALSRIAKAAGCHDRALKEAKSVRHLGEIIVDAVAQMKANAMPWSRSKGPYPAGAPLLTEWQWRQLHGTPAKVYLVTREPWQVLGAYRAADVASRIAGEDGWVAQMEVQ